VIHQCTPMGEFLTNDTLLREHFPYVRRSGQGEFIIPEDMVGAFVLKYIDLVNNKQHLELLSLYRAGKARPATGEIDD